MPCDPQDSIVTSSQDGTKPTQPMTKGVKQQRKMPQNKMVAKVLPTVRREEGAGGGEEGAGGGDGEGQGAKPVRPRGFPWMAEFAGRCQKALGSRSYDRLDRLMVLYERHLSRDVRTCYRGPNRAHNLKCQMQKHMNMFYLFYADVLQPIENDHFVERMIRLISFYLDMELKASRRGRESPKSVSARLTSVLFHLLGNKMVYIAEAIVESKFFGKKYHEICILIIEKLYRKLMEARPVKLETHADYVNCILVFRKWKKMLAKAEWGEVSGKAARCVLPPPGFMDVYYGGKASGKWTRRLPALPRSGPRPAPDRFTYGLVQGGVKNTATATATVTAGSEDEEDCQITTTDAKDGVISVVDTDDFELCGDATQLALEDCEQPVLQPQDDRRVTVPMRSVWGELSQMSVTAVDCPFDSYLYADEFLAQLHKECARDDTQSAVVTVVGRRRASKDCYEKYPEAGVKLEEDDVPPVEPDSPSYEELVKQEPEEPSAVPVGRVVPTASPDRVPPLLSTDKISPPVSFSDRIIPVEKIPPVIFADKTVPDDEGPTVEPEEIPPPNSVNRISSSDGILVTGSAETIPCEYRTLSVDSSEQIRCDHLSDRIPPADSSDYIPVADSDTRIPLVGSCASRALPLPLPLVLPDNIVLSEESLELIQALAMQDSVVRPQEAEMPPALGVELVTEHSVDEDEAGALKSDVCPPPDRKNRDTEQPSRVPTGVEGTLAFESSPKSEKRVQEAGTASEIDPLLTNADPPPIDPSADPQLLQLWTTSENDAGGNEEEMYPDAGDMTAMYGGGPWGVTYEDLFNQYHSGDFTSLPDLDTPEMSWTQVQGDPFWSPTPIEILDDAAYMQQTTHFDGYSIVPSSDQQATNFGGFNMVASDHHQQQQQQPPPTPSPSPSPSPPPSVVFHNGRKGRRGPKKRCQDQKTNKVEEYILCKRAKEKGTVEEVSKKKKPGRKPGRKRSHVAEETDNEEVEPPPCKRPTQAGRKRKQERPPPSPSPPPSPPPPLTPPAPQAGRGRGSGRGRGRGRKPRRR